MVLKKFTGIITGKICRGFLIKNLTRKFKYQPFIKELAKTLSFLIIEHFQLPDNKPDFKNFTPHHFPDNKTAQKRKINQK